jgi:hypothetical protein
MEENKAHKAAKADKKFDFIDIIGTSTSNKAIIL